MIDKAVFGERKMESIAAPLFLKDFTKESSQLKDLENLYNRIKDGEKKSNIGKDIYALRKGIDGENNTYFELRHSNVPFICMHDIRLEYDNLTAQIDFIVLTKQYICIIETKKLYGNIEINKEGEFIRFFKDRLGKTFREGMYSPYEQNRKHVNLVSKILKNEFNINRMPVKSLVVLANPKTIVNKDKCPEEIKQQIIRHENLTKNLESLVYETEYSLKEERVFDIANYLLRLHKPIDFNYKAKYGLVDDDFITDSKRIINCEKQEINVEKQTEDKSELSNNDLILELKNYRNSKARQEGYEYTRYHFIFSNSVIEQLASDKPKTKSDLFSIKGLGEVKIGKYGQEILDIIKKHSHNEKQNVLENMKVNQATQAESSNKEELISMLKEYRLKTSRALNIKPYIIFNNDQMEDLIQKMPTSKEELLSVKGFDSKRVNSFGENILEILNKAR